MGHPRRELFPRSTPQNLSPAALNHRAAPGKRYLTGLSARWRCDKVLATASAGFGLYPQFKPL